MRNTLVGIAALLAGCSGASQTGDTTKTAGAQAQPAAEASVKGQGTNTPNTTKLAAADMISMERTPCYGTCPVYTILVSGDGAVSFDGRTHVLKTGKATARISGDLVASL